MRLLKTDISDAEKNKKDVKYKMSTDNNVGEKKKLSIVKITLISILCVVVIAKVIAVVLPIVNQGIYEYPAEVVYLEPVKPEIDD